MDESQSPEYRLQLEAVVEAILERHEIASDIVPAHQFQDTGYDRLEIIEWGVDPAEKTSFSP